jgi:hypothetical protein
MPPTTTIKKTRPATTNNQRDKAKGRAGTVESIHAPMAAAARPAKPNEKSHDVMLYLMK